MKYSLIGAQVAAMTAGMVARHEHPAAIDIQDENGEVRHIELPTGRKLSTPEMQDLASGMLVRKDGENVPLDKFIDVDYSDIENRLLSYYSDPVDFAKLVMGAEPEPFQADFMRKLKAPMYETPYDSIEWRGQRVRAPRRFREGPGKTPSRSKAARKARAVTRKNRK